MNFQGLQSVETYDVYLDTAFGRAKKKGAEAQNSLRTKDKVIKAKTVEIRKVDSVRDVLREAMLRIEDSFPSMDELPEFYKELSAISFDVDETKRSLGALRWTTEQISGFARETTKNIKKATTKEKVLSYRQAFYGRVSSVMKRINKHLKFLEQVRRTMKAFPTVKESLYTVAIVGFPNVGKSTLLSKITTSDVEINSYAFTTKSLLIGYRKMNNHKIQFMDTPGTLNRDEKKNVIEKQAELAMKYVADLMIYVFDPTELYPFEKQERLLRNVKKFRKQIILYLSKTDIADQDIIDEIKEKHKGILTTEDELLAAIREKHLNADM
ncbi:MAG: NOG1 family protein [Nanoarchaeota archaeon]